MSDRVSKPLHPKTKKRKSLFQSVVRNALAMDKRCSYCVSRGHEECLLSPSDSSRCAECVRLNKSYCDIRGLSSEQLERIAAHHFRLEDELEAAEEERRAADAKVERLRKEKKRWYEKMRRGISRGITDVEELDRVEREEQEAEAARQAAMSVPNPAGSGIPVSSVGAIDWGQFDVDPLLPFLGSGVDGNRQPTSSHLQGSQ
jgi:uncharacterized protein YdcH (DUF465 family)